MKAIVQDRYGSPGVSRLRARPPTQRPIPRPAPAGLAVGAAGAGYGRGCGAAVRFCTAPDGVRLAYAVHGSGPPLVRVATWLSHLELDWESPVWRHWLKRLGERHTLVRYDERGSGLSDTNIGDPAPSRPRARGSEVTARPRVAEKA
jgi:hypothetical protein